MLKEGGLTKAEREMIVVATAGAANDCLYCIVAHRRDPAHLREESARRARDAIGVSPVDDKLLRRS